MINERVDCMSKFDIHLALDIAQDIIPPSSAANTMNCT